MSANKQLRPSGTTHILLDDRGCAWVEGTNVRVDQVVADVIGVNQYSPKQILEAYPHSNLSFARIHAALAWYYDHQAEMDAEFERDRQEYLAARKKQQESPEFQALMAKWAERASRLAQSNTPAP